MERKTEFIILRVTPTLKKLYEKLSRAHEETLSEFIRKILEDYADRE